MGKSIYYIIVAAVIILGMIMAQKGEARKPYIVIMAILHTFVSGFRYQFLTGDLIKYNTLYQDYRYFGWFSERVFQEGRNFGFQWLMKLVCHLTDGNYQIFLLVVAIIIELAVAILIFRYSPKPWLSYLMWNCIGFYVFGFSAVKQSLAMAILIFSYMSIIEKKPKQFVFWTLLAGTIHLPALAFLPAYPISKLKLNIKTLIGYVVSAILIFVFREPIVTAISDMYYSETYFAADTFLGTRFLVMCLMLVIGVLLKGFRGKHFSSLFMLIGVATILQMFCGYDNIFTRLADYYFQFVILYVPMLFESFEDDYYHSRLGPQLVFDDSMKKMIVAFLVIFAIYFYSTSSLASIHSSIDDYTNYRFFWEVSPTP
ncbi:MAG: EpsG family protein [Clostridia bacterium]|nr:EpsG family protein [Clostridia bacterium]